MDRQSWYSVVRLMIDIGPGLHGSEHLYRIA